MPGRKLVSFGTTLRTLQDLLAKTVLVIPELSLMIIKKKSHSLALERKSSQIVKKEI